MVRRGSLETTSAKDTSFILLPRVVATYTTWYAASPRRRQYLVRSWKNQAPRGSSISCHVPPTSVSRELSKENEGKEARREGGGVQWTRLLGCALAYPAGKGRLSVGTGMEGCCTQACSASCFIPVSIEACCNLFWFPRSSFRLSRRHAFGISRATSAAGGSACTTGARRLLHRCRCLSFLPRIRSLKKTMNEARTFPPYFSRCGAVRRSCCVFPTS